MVPCRRFLFLLAAALCLAVVASPAHAITEIVFDREQADDSSLGASALPEAKGLPPAPLNPRPPGRRKLAPAVVETEEVEALPSKKIAPSPAPPAPGALPPGHVCTCPIHGMPAPKNTMPVGPAPSPFFVCPQCAGFVPGMQTLSTATPVPPTKGSILSTHPLPSPTRSAPYTMNTQVPEPGSVSPSNPMSVEPMPAPVSGTTPAPAPGMPQAPGAPMTGPMPPAPPAPASQQSPYQLPPAHMFAQPAPYAPMPAVTIHGIDTQNTQIERLQTNLAQSQLQLGAAQNQVSNTQLQLSNSQMEVVNLQKELAQLRALMAQPVQITLKGDQAEVEWSDAKQVIPVPSSKIIELQLAPK